MDKDCDKNSFECAEFWCGRREDFDADLEANLEGIGICSVIWENLDESVRVLCFDVKCLF